MQNEDIIVINGTTSNNLQASAVRVAFKVCEIDLDKGLANLTPLEDDLKQRLLNVKHNLNSIFELLTIKNHEK